MRLFVALTPPGEAVAGLDAALAPARAAHPGLRWAPAVMWHVTLAFLGEVSEDKLPRLLPRLERAAARHEALPLSFRGAGAFPSPRRASVLWSGLHGDAPALGRLAESVTAGARRACALPAAERSAGGGSAGSRRQRFRAHLTVARSREPADLRDLVAQLAGYAGPEWTAREVHLIRSWPGPAPRYETLACCPLRAPAP